MLPFLKQRFVREFYFREYLHLATLDCGGGGVARDTPHQHKYDHPRGRAGGEAAGPPRPPLLHVRRRPPGGPLLAGHLQQLHQLGHRRQAVRRQAQEFPPHVFLR